MPFPFIQYIYIFILFIFAFISWFNPTIEIIGFGSVFVMQTVYTFFLAMDIISNADRGKSVIKIPFAEKMKGIPSSFPIYWMLLIGTIPNLVSILMLMIAISYIYKRHQSIQISRNDRLLLTRYKIMFITVFAIIVILNYVYSTNMEPGEKMRLFLFLSCVGIFVLTKVNVFFANSFTKVLTSSVDG